MPRRAVVHRLVWTPTTALGRVALVHALRTLVTGQPPPILWRGMPDAAGAGTGAPG